MKTTLDIPDRIFRRAKAKAADQGIPLRQFVTDAVAEKLRVESPAAEKPWLRLAGRLRHLKKENVRINQVIEREFERIEPEEWT
jgi:hypothetical protein